MEISIFRQLVLHKECLQRNSNKEINHLYESDRLMTQTRLVETGRFLGAKYVAPWPVEEKKYIPGSVFQRKTKTQKCCNKIQNDHFTIVQRPWACL